ncbi:AAA family ATPase [Methanocaldococcus fervens]|uniref:DNA double-strand break repair Rad50 ATPase n=1 Tax=Methanocaldococcus fervens (strain DSM 4213 / JCM 15782 / AG86) TaxID=573064 RepID=C7P7E8_METFA|nr:AAA family ATPase [Methanocaldococcus fervens]ACV24480.1 SMC domain protein [Methanocaldococcus fervens AG86]
MIINSITINNFKSHVNTKITFNDGIIAIIGENGSGKSSIFEAMFFALFGADALRRMGLTYDEIITKGKKAMSVELDFEVNGNSYKVVREYDGRSSAKLYKNNELYAKTVNEVNRAISEILGVDKDMFLNSIYIKQGEIANLLNLPPADRKEVIGKLLGIDDFEKCYQKMRDVINEYRNQLKEVEVNLSYKEKFEKDLKEKENQLAEKEKELERIKANIDKIKTEYETAKKNFVEWKEKKSLYEKLINKLEEREKALELEKNKLKNLKYDLDEVLKANEILKSHKGEYGEYKSLTNRIKEIERRLRDLQPAYEEYIKLSKTLENIEKDIKELKEFVDKSKYKDRLDELNEILESIKKRIEEVEKTAELLGELEILSQKLNEIEKYKKIANECKKYYEEYLKLEEKINEYNKLNLEYTKLLQNKESIEENIKNLNCEIENIEKELNGINIEEIKKSLEEIEKKKEELSQLQKEKEELKQKIGEINNEINRLKKILDELKDVEGKCPLCKTPIDENKKLDLINSHKSQLDNKYNELEEIKRKIKEIENEIDKINNEIAKEKQFREIETKYYEKKKRLEDLTLKMNGLKKELIMIENKLSSYIVNGKPINEILEEYKTKLNEIRDKYNEYISAKNYLDSVDEENLRRNFEDIKEKVKGWFKEKCKEEIKKLRDEEKEITYLINKIEELKKKENEFKNVENKMLLKLGMYKEYLSLNEALNDCRKRVEELENIYKICNSAEITLNNIKRKYGKEDIENYINNKILEVNEKIKDIKERIDYINQKLNEINYSEEEFKKIEEEFEKKQEKLKNAEIEKGKIESEIKYLRDDIETLNLKLKELSDLEKEKEKLIKFIDYLNKVRSVFGKDGFQKYLRKIYTPLIQKYLNEAFNEFDLPYSFVELTEDLEIKLHSPTGVLTIDNLSGGEQIAVALSLRLAIANALIGNKVECIILDEPTVYLDENRRAKLAEIFRKINSVPQMIIITHHRELEEVADTIVNVTKERGVSKVKINES